ncbi:MAG: YdcF family protein [bacterium]|nr:YdcF family protein [bacterium]
MIDGMPGWNPTPDEVALAEVAVLSDVIPAQCDAVLIHGAPARDNELDQRLLASVVEKYKARKVSAIVINGLSVDDCVAKNLAYAGYEPWQQFLMSQGVHPDDIVILEPSVHTGAESVNFLKLAFQNGWGKLMISTHPHHQMRCFLQIISMIKELGISCDVYNAPGPGIPWKKILIKTALKGGTVNTQDLNAPLAHHIKHELKSAIRYAQVPAVKDGKREFTPNASIPEMLKYLDKRR